MGSRFYPVQTSQRVPLWGKEVTVTGYGVFHVRDGIEELYLADSIDDLGAYLAERLVKDELCGIHQKPPGPMDPNPTTHGYESMSVEPVDAGDLDRLVQQAGLGAGVDGITRPNTEVWLASVSEQPESR